MVSLGHRGVDKGPVAFSATSIITLRTCQVNEEGSAYESNNAQACAASPLPLQELSFSQSIYADQQIKIKPTSTHLSSPLYGSRPPWLTFKITVIVKTKATSC